jgi:hypothetical protein
MTAAIDEYALPGDAQTAGADPCPQETGSGLRKQLEAANAEKRQMAERLVEAEIGRRALALQVAAMRVHPDVSALPEELFVEAVALLDGLNRQLADAGATAGDVAVALGELPTATVWLVANVWRRQGRLPAEPPAQVRRLEAVTAS